MAAVTKVVNERNFLLLIQMLFLSVLFIILTFRFSSSEVPGNFPYIREKNRTRDNNSEKQQQICYF